MLQKLRTTFVITTLLVCSITTQTRVFAETTEIIRLKAGAVACDLSPGWQVVDQEQAGTRFAPGMYARLLADAEGMVAAYSHYHNSGQDVNSKHGVKEFTAAKFPNGRGYIRAYAFHLKPQQAYYTTAQGYNHTVTTEMEKQKKLAKVSDNGPVMVGDREFLKLDMTYSNQNRVITMAYWNVTNPDLVSHIDVVLLPQATDEDSQTAETVLSSIQTHDVAPPNAQIGQFSMHVPSGWSELSNMGNLDDRLTDRIRAYANAGGQAIRPDDKKLYKDDSGSRITAWTITLNQGKDFLPAVYSAQSAALENERANLKRGTCRLGIIGDHHVVRVFKEYNNGDRRTTYLTWKWFSPGDADSRTSFMTAVEVNVSASEPESKDAAVLDSIGYNTPARAAVVPMR